MHLKGLRQGLIAALSQVPLDGGPVLDLFCGTQPYRDLLGDGLVCGVDIDMHFGSADVLADQPLPFADKSFSLVFCTQALNLIEEDEALVAEMQRVTGTGSYAVVTVAHLFLKARSLTERRYRSREFESLFSDWGSVEVFHVGGLRTGMAYMAGSILQALVRRVRWAQPLTTGLAIGVNLFGLAVDAIARPLADRWPATLIAVARR